LRQSPVVNHLSFTCRFTCYPHVSLVLTQKTGYNTLSDRHLRTESGTGNPCVVGTQHLADADAYRRDRRKDALLQENGYFVLRFLAEDAGKRLDEVLNAILRTLAPRGKKQ